MNSFFKERVEPNDIFVCNLDPVRPIGTYNQYH